MPGERLFRSASRFAGVEISLIRQINALARPGSINLGIGEPNVEPDAHFLELARHAASATWHYSPNAGFLEVRKAVVRAQRYDVDPESEVCLTAGTQEALYAIMQALVQPGDEVLIPDPGFVAYGTVASLAGAAVQTYPLDVESWQPDLGALRKAITAATRIIVVNSPSNPTGGVVAEDALAEIAEIARDAGVLVISDEVYAEIFYQARPATMCGRGDHIITISGVSKSHAMTGLRLGWVIAHRELMKSIVKAHQYIATCAPVFTQKLAQLVFEDETWNGQWLEKTRAKFALQREAMLSAVEEHIQRVSPLPGGAFYVFTPVPSCDTVALARALATEAGVLTIPGVAFGRSVEGFLRLSYANDVDQIREGVARIGTHLAKSGR